MNVPEKKDVHRERERERCTRSTYIRMNESTYKGIYTIIARVFISLFYILDKATDFFSHPAKKMAKKKKTRREESFAYNFSVYILLSIKISKNKDIKELKKTYLLGKQQTFSTHTHTWDAIKKYAHSTRWRIEGRRIPGSDCVAQCSYIAFYIYIKLKPNKKIGLRIPLYSYSVEKHFAGRKKIISHLCRGSEKSREKRVQEQKRNQQKREKNMRKRKNKLEKEDEKKHTKRRMEILYFTLNIIAPFSREYKRKSGSSCSWIVHKLITLAIKTVAGNFFSI